MLQSTLLVIAAVIVAISATNQVFRGTGSQTAAGLAGMATILFFLWAVGLPVVGFIVVGGLLLLAFPSRS